MATFPNRLPIELLSKGNTMNKQTHEMLSRLERCGISTDDAMALRRISMTLQRWHELECGTENAAGSSVSVERDEDTGKCYQRVQYWSQFAGKKNSHGQAAGGWVEKRRPVADRETGALRRLAAIMARYPALRSYVQGDPRGAALYILRPDDVPVGGSDDAYYSRGVAVYK